MLKCASYALPHTMETLYLTAFANFVAIPAFFRRFTITGVVRYCDMGHVDVSSAEAARLDIGQTRYKKRPSMRARSMKARLRTRPLETKIPIMTARGKAKVYNR